jgi:hypothetical protein
VRSERLLSRHNHLNQLKVTVVPTILHHAHTLSNQVQREYFAAKRRFCIFSVVLSLPLREHVITRPASLGPKWPWSSVCYEEQLPRPFSGWWGGYCILAFTLYPKSQYHRLAAAVFESGRAFSSLVRTQSRCVVVQAPYSVLS